jgi:hypothetical protein
VPWIEDLRLLGTAERDRLTREAKEVLIALDEAITEITEGKN